MLRDARPTVAVIPKALDAALDECVDLYCKGGFAAAQAYPLRKATADIDFYPSCPIRALLAWWSSLPAL
jgi:hypothetical protein